MATPAAAGVLLLILLGIGCTAGITVAAVLLRRLHLSAQSQGEDGRSGPGGAAHPKA